MLVFSHLRAGVQEEGRLCAILSSNPLHSAFSTVPARMCSRTESVSPCRTHGSLCLEQTAPMFLVKTQFKVGLGSQNSRQCPRETLLSVPVINPLTSPSHPRRKTNTWWPGSVLNNFYYMFSVLYTKEISFFTVIQKKILIIWPFRCSCSQFISPLLDGPRWPRRLPCSRPCVTPSVASVADRVG